MKLDLNSIRKNLLGINVSTSYPPLLLSDKQKESDLNLLRPFFPHCGCSRCFSAGISLNKEVKAKPSKTSVVWHPQCASLGCPVTQAVAKAKPCTNNPNATHAHTWRANEQQLLSELWAWGRGKGCKMMQGARKELHIQHCSHLILQVFSPSWCGVADSQTEHLLNYSGMCSLDVLWAVGFSLFSFLLPTLFIPSHSATFESTHGTWTSSPAWVGCRSAVCQSALGLNNRRKKRFRSLERNISIAQKKQDMWNSFQAAVLLHCPAEEKQPFLSIHQHWRSEWECCQLHQLINGQYIAKKKNTKPFIWQRSD